MAKIVIFSENGDASTSDIVTWIMSYNKKIVRINRDDPSLQIISIKNTDITIQTSYGDFVLNIDDIYWFRRAAPYSVFALDSKKEKLKEIKTFQFLECRDTWNSLLWWVLDHCEYCDNPFSSSVDKLHTLNVAMQEGFLTPSCIITNSKKDAIEFIKKERKVAVKSFNSLMLPNGKNIIKSLTNCLTVKDIKKIPDKFNTLIFQKYIEKKYELRVFMFNYKFYTMAIFSQKDKSTQIDFRNYNDDIPNITIPFHLPSHYAKKLKKISKKLSLTSGSFDIIVDPNDDYYFLEVNPVGQFGMVTIPCNFQAEKEIAKYLISKLNYYNENKKLRNNKTCKSKQ